MVESHIIEFKPNNERAIREGLAQAERYARLLEERYGRRFTSEVIPYEKPWITKKLFSQ
jgi:hypothetical protein